MAHVELVDLQATINYHTLIMCDQFAAFCKQTADVEHGIKGFLRSGGIILSVPDLSGEGDNFHFSSKAVLRSMGYTRNGGDQALREFVPSDCKPRLRELLPAEESGAFKAATTRYQLDEIWIPEKGLYKLALKSRLPGAVKFQEFVTDELLPWIRRATSRAYKLELLEQRDRVASQAAQISGLQLELEEEKRSHTLLSGSFDHASNILCNTL